LLNYRLPLCPEVASWAAHSRQRALEGGLAMKTRSRSRKKQGRASIGAIFSKFLTSVQDKKLFFLKSYRYLIIMLNMARFSWVYYPNLLILIS
jgi:hypothetical protein